MPYRGKELIHDLHKNPEPKTHASSLSQLGTEVFGALAKFLWTTLMNIYHEYSH